METTKASPWCDIETAVPFHMLWGRKPLKWNTLSMETPYVESDLKQTTEYINVKHYDIGKIATSMGY